MNCIEKNLKILEVGEKKKKIREDRIITKKKEGDR